MIPIEKNIQTDEQISGHPGRREQNPRIDGSDQGDESLPAGIRLHDGREKFCFINISYIPTFLYRCSNSQVKISEY